MDDKSGRATVAGALPVFQQSIFPSRRPASCFENWSIYGCTFKPWGLEPIGYLLASVWSMCKYSRTRNLRQSFRQPGSACSAWIVCRQRRAAQIRHAPGCWGQAHRSSHPSRLFAVAVVASSSATCGQCVQFAGSQGETWPQSEMQCASSITSIPAPL